MFNVKKLFLFLYGKSTGLVTISIWILVLLKRYSASSTVATSIIFAFEAFSGNKDFIFSWSISSPSFNKSILKIIIPPVML